MPPSLPLKLTGIWRFQALGLRFQKPTPNNSLQRTHQSVTLFASQKLRLFAGPLSSGR